jgi:hypothetical protein
MTLRPAFVEECEVRSSSVRVQFAVDARVVALDKIWLMT